MKKITSLVLALVMVFAIAASASALTGDIYEVGPTASGVLPYTNINLKLVESIPSAAVPGFGLLSLTQVAAGKAYYTNQALYFALEYTTPAVGTITMDEDDYIDPAVLISSTNVEFWPGTFALYVIGTGSITGGAVDAADMTVASAGKKVTVAIDGPDTNAIQYILVGGGIVRGTASGAIRADFAGDIDCVKFFGAVTGSNIGTLITAANDEFGSDGAAHPIYSSKDKILYTVEMSGETDPVYTIVVYNAAGTTPIGEVEFFTESDDTVAGSTKNVEEITATLAGGDTYYVNDTGVDISGGGTSSLQFFRATGEDALEVLSSGTATSTYGQLKSLYQGVMSFFGLSFSRQGILLPIHFAQKFSTFYAWSNEVKVALSTAVATDPDLELPATGDAATAAGFVMIALAVVAACGLAYRKVRG